MNIDELNSFISRYAKEYKTKTAMLLTGEWGVGKSYYIKESLIPYLEDNKIQSVVVSLYGVDNLSGLSKQIFLQLRFPTLSQKSEIKEYASIVGGNVVNNLLSMKGISFSISDKRLLQLYESVNLKGILLILEDAERSSIDILKLLGYINGLVEYDGAKVLLVANEGELLGLGKDFCLENIDNENIKDSPNDKLNEKGYPFSEKYKRIKEKTIGDTIYYYPNLFDAVKDIVTSFKGQWIDMISDDSEIDKLAGIVTANCNKNLRVLIYALQKYCDIFQQISSFLQFEPEFYQATIEGLVIISNSFIKSDIPKWEGTKYISSKLGLPSSPVFRFVYDYLRWNMVSEDTVIASQKEYQNYRYFDKNASRGADEDLFIINSYYLQTEKNVLNALQNIEKKLKNPNYLGLYAYEKLAFLIIQAGEVVGYDTNKICTLMIKNAKKMCRDSEEPSEDIIWGIYAREDENENVKSRYSNFISELSKVIDDQKSSLVLFSYKPENIKQLYKEIVKGKKNIQITISLLAILI